MQKYTLSLIHQLNPTINAIVALQDEQALIEQARLADSTPVSGSLHGIPLAIKDAVNVAGIVSTFGSPLLRDYIPAKDDEAARRMRGAGGIVIGKTNTPEFGLTPYDISKTSGGSSGGAAAALASGMLIIADGSDMMGSLRNPAAFCNVYGFRPSYGLVPLEPKADTFMHPLATLGPMARTIEDLATLLDVMAGPDDRHPHSLPIEPNFKAAISAQPKKAQRIAWLADWDGKLAFEPGVLEVCEDAAYGRGVTGTF